MNGLRRPQAHTARLSSVFVRVEGVVGRNRAVLVEPQHLPEEAVDVLRRLGAWLVVVSDRDVELAVSAEMHRSAVVVGGGAERRQVEDRKLAARRGDVTLRGEAADPIVRGRARDGVVEVHVVVAVEARVEGDSEQPPLVDGVDRQADEGRRKQLAVPDHANVAVLEGDEQPAAGIERHRRRTLEPGGDERVDEARRRRRDPRALRKAARGRLPRGRPRALRAGTALSPSPSSPPDRTRSRPVRLRAGPVCFTLGTRAKRPRSEPCAHLQPQRQGPL